MCIFILIFLSLSLSLSLPLSSPPSLPPLSLTPQIEDISLIYYRRDDNDIKYLDLDASIEEQVADLDLICDKWVHSIHRNTTMYVIYHIIVSIIAV